MLTILVSVKMAFLRLSEGANSWERSKFNSKKSRVVYMGLAKV